MTEVNGSISHVPWQKELKLLLFTYYAKSFTHSMKSIPKFQYRSSQNWKLQS
jgi:hypothetical protein